MAQTLSSFIDELEGKGYFVLRYFELNEFPLVIKYNKSIRFLFFWYVRDAYKKCFFGITKLLARNHKEKRYTSGFVLTDFVVIVDHETGDIAVEFAASSRDKCLSGSGSKEKDLEYLHNLINTVLDRGLKQNSDLKIPEDMVAYLRELLNPSSTFEFSQHVALWTDTQRINFCQNLINKRSGPVKASVDLAISTLQAVLVPAPASQGTNVQTRKRKSMNNAAVGKAALVPAPASQGTNVQTRKRKSMNNAAVGNVKSMNNAAVGNVKSMNNAAVWNWRTRIESNNAPLVNVLDYNRNRHYNGNSVLDMCVFIRNFLTHMKDQPDPVGNPRNIEDVYIAVVSYSYFWKEIEELQRLIAATQSIRLDNFSVNLLQYLLR